jgi:hypothetical protein
MLTELLAAEMGPFEVGLTVACVLGGWVVWVAILAYTPRPRGPRETVVMGRGQIVTSKEGGRADRR